MKMKLDIMIPYGVEHPSFVNFVIHENMESISFGRLYMDGTAYVSCWKDTSYMVEEVDASTIYDVVDGKTSGAEFVRYLLSARLEQKVITKTEMADKEYHKDLRDDYLINNFHASNMKEVMQKKKENQKKLKKIIMNAVINL